MTNWIDIGAESDFGPGTATECVVADRIVAVFNVDGDFHAMDGVCPHQGGPIGKGEVQGCIVTCPWHGWQFDVRDGQSQLSPEVQHPTFDAKVEGGRVLIAISE